MTLYFCFAKLIVAYKKEDEFSMNIHPNTYTVFYPSDFYEHLLLLSGQQITLEDGFILYNCEDTDFEFVIKRMILSAGFEISISEYSINDDIDINYNIEYEGIEILAIYDDIKKEPLSVGYRLRFKDESKKVTDIMSLQKGKYTCINIYIDKSYLKEYINIRYFIYARNKNWNELKGDSRNCLILVLSQVIGCCYKGDALRVFYHSKSLEILSFILNDALTTESNLSLPALSMMKSDTDALYKAKTIIEEQYYTNITIPQIAKQVHMSANKLMSCYHKLFGMTIKSHIIYCRMKQALHLIKDQGKNVAEVSTTIGYSHQGHFIKTFNKYFGITPGKLKI